ncbi:hypothetical protein IMCC20628_01432 [Hoeflea sp. IMCC20628]|uniref:hypothetical protein n=1 Tax=Hoeflea sp. IMCC20628 TaxID=1620421 RepID=UPI00063A8A4F|nr:hypothetical protein [Hoeflea sp. IMCC20628]AKI00149.1 hypothetical protein IMCC20628_01432 [Hoeflea sp. IMCC20628]
MRGFVFGLGLATLAAIPAQAAGEDVFTVVAEVPFADAAQGVNDAIINKGFKVDYHGFIGEMLKRTAGDVGATKELYTDAEFFTFCSAVVSRDVMEADIGDIAYCPYVVFVYEDAATPGKVTIGHRNLPEGGARDQVNELLGDIVKTAADGF